MKPHDEGGQNVKGIRGHTLLVRKVSHGMQCTAWWLQLTTLYSTSEGC